MSPFEDGWLSGLELDHVRRLDVAVADVCCRHGEGSEQREQEQGEAVASAGERDGKPDNIQWRPFGDDAVRIERGAVASDVDSALAGLRWRTRGDARVRRTCG